MGGVGAAVAAGVAALLPKKATYAMGVGRASGFPAYYGTCDLCRRPAVSMSAPTREITKPGDKWRSYEKAGPVMRRCEYHGPGTMWSWRAEHHRQMAGGLTMNEIREHDSRT